MTDEIRWLLWPAFGFMLGAGYGVWLCQKIMRRNRSWWESAVKKARSEGAEEGARDAWETAKNAYRKGTLR